MLEKEKFKESINKLMSSDNEADRLTIAKEIYDQYSTDFDDHVLLQNNNEIVTSERDKFKRLANDNWIMTNQTINNGEHNEPIVNEDVKPKRSFEDLYDKQI